MNRCLLKLGLFLTLLFSTISSYASLDLSSQNEFPTSPRAEKSILKVRPALKTELASKGLQYGAPIFIRLFKKSRTLELWLQTDSGLFKKFKDYEICAYSGDLGPKLFEGDKQSPEGFYFVNARRLNPWSDYHLAFNIGFPNAYDRYYKRSGSALMIHGKCLSIGCYAITDERMNEVYALASAALENGQAFFRVHAFPFKLERSELAEHRFEPWYDFWVNLKEGYDFFNRYQRPPNVTVENGKYIFHHE